MPTTTRSLTPQQIEQIAEAAAEKAAVKVMRQTLLSMGIDPDDMVQSQSNNAALRDMIGLFKDQEYQKDRAHLRKIRVYSERMANFSLAALITAIVSGAAAMLWAGYQAVMKLPPHPPP